MDWATRYSVRVPRHITQPSSISQCVANDGSLNTGLNSWRISCKHGNMTHMGGTPTLGQGWRLVLWLGFPRLLITPSRLYILICLSPLAKDQECKRPRPQGVPGMCILPQDQPHASVAALLDGQARQQLALAALSGVPISQIAAEKDVSRKFVYQQLHKAHQGLDLAF